MNIDKAIPNQVAMTIVMIMIGMLFATLFLSYFIFRWTADVWPPLGTPRPEIFLPTLSSISILASSFMYRKFEKTFNTTWFYTSFVFGIIFLFIQGLFWINLRDIGLYTSTGTYSSLLHAFTWIHAGHVVLGLMAFTWPYLLIRKSVNKEVLENTLKIKNVGLIWHFLGMIWIVLFINLFVL